MHVDRPRLWEFPVQTCEIDPTPSSGNQYRRFRESCQRITSGTAQASRDAIGNLPEAAISGMLHPSISRGSSALA
jgi:hypothetical protein